MGARPSTAASVWLDFQPKPEAWKPSMCAHFLAAPASPFT